MKQVYKLMVYAFILFIPTFALPKIPKIPNITKVELPSNVAEAARQAGVQAVKGLNIRFK